jgi:hypothetical protein
VIAVLQTASSGSTLSYECLPPVWGSVGGNCLIPHFSMTSIKVIPQGVSSSDIPPQTASSSSKPMERQNLKLIASKVGRFHWKR